MNRIACLGWQSARQSGVALLLGLVMLAAISLLALVATSSMILQQRMAGNFSDAQSARLAAAWAISQGEDFLFGVEQDQRVSGCSTRCFLPPANAVIRQPDDLPPFPEHEDLSWWRSWGTTSASGADSGSGLASTDQETPPTWPFGSEEPRFLIAEVHFEPFASSGTSEAPPIDGVAYYRILGRGTGRGEAIAAVDEAIVARPWLGAHAIEPSPPAGNGYCAPFRPWYDCGRMSWRQRK